MEFAVLAVLIFLLFLGIAFGTGCLKVWKFSPNEPVKIVFKTKETWSLWQVYNLDLTKIWSGTDDSSTKIYADQTLYKKRQIFIFLGVNLSQKDSVHLLR